MKTTPTRERIEEIRANHVAWIKYQSPLVTFTTGELLAFIDDQAEEIRQLRDQLLDKCIDDTDARVTTLLADRVILEQDIKSITAERDEWEQRAISERTERDRLAARCERLREALILGTEGTGVFWRENALAHDDEEKG